MYSFDPIHCALTSPRLCRKIITQFLLFTLDDDDNDADMAVAMGGREELRM